MKWFHSLSNPPSGFIQYVLVERKKSYVHGALIYVLRSRTRTAAIGVCQPLGRQVLASAQLYVCIPCQPIRASWTFSISALDDDAFTLRRLFENTRCGKVSNRGDLRYMA